MISQNYPICFFFLIIKNINFNQNQIWMYIYLKHFVIKTIIKYYLYLIICTNGKGHDQECEFKIRNWALKIVLSDRLLLINNTFNPC